MRDKTDKQRAWSWTPSTLDEEAEEAWLKPVFPITYFSIREINEGRASWGRRLCCEKWRYYLFGMKKKKGVCVFEKVFMLYYSAPLLGGKLGWRSCLCALFVWSVAVCRLGGAQYVNQSAPSVADTLNAKFLFRASTHITLWQTAAEAAGKRATVRGKLEFIQPGILISAEGITITVPQIPVRYTQEVLQTSVNLQIWLKWHKNREKISLAWGSLVKMWLQLCRTCLMSLSTCSVFLLSHLWHVLCIR